MTASKGSLPATYTGANLGRITRYAAAAVLAQVYLTQGDKANAAKELKEIIDSNQYSLDANRDGKVNKDDYAFFFNPAPRTPNPRFWNCNFWRVRMPSTVITSRFTPPSTGHSTYRV